MPNSFIFFYLGHVVSTQILLENGADVTLIDEEGKTALDIATDEILFQANPFKPDKTGHHRVVELLTQKKT